MICGDFSSGFDLWVKLRFGFELLLLLGISALFVFLLVSGGFRVVTLAFICVLCLLWVVWYLRIVVSLFFVWLFGCVYLIYYYLFRLSFCWIICFLFVGLEVLLVVADVLTFCV